MRIDMVTDSGTRLSVELSARYKIERELGQGGMGPQMNADGSGFTRMKL